MENIRSQPRIRDTDHCLRCYLAPERDNPADCASRGLRPSELLDHTLWWNGPSWLSKEANAWPAQAQFNFHSALPEERSLTHAASTRVTELTEPEELLRFSNLHRLLRVTTWCRRWLSRPQAAPSMPGPNTRARSLSTDELESARLAWIRVIQNEQYASIIKAVKAGEATSNSHLLTRLSPFLDKDGILRVGGRLKHAILSYDERHPVILPRDSHFTRLVIEAIHRRSLHGGVQLTLGLVRQWYWIPRGRSAVKTILSRCVPCVRWRAAAPQQIMGDLPRWRVTPARPFLNTGVDYAGSVHLRTTKVRGHRSYKAFIALFVCMATRAVHLEVVSDYSASAFRAALRRFVSRRGLCRTLSSDCGTTFIGADAQLRALLSASSPEMTQIVGQLAVDGIAWKFNPPAASHFGGLWEAAVKSVKHHLRKVIGDSRLTFEEMSTLLTQIEACLNSRPLQALFDDPGDLSALTPGHFLIGSALTALPEPSLATQLENQLSRWKLLQRMRDHFWNRWSHEYLHSLTHRPKWWKSQHGYDIGRLCLLRHENTPPTRWPLVRIMQLHPGKDGHVRVITVRTAASQFTRPVVKLVHYTVLLHVSTADDSEIEPRTPRDQVISRPN